MQRSRDSVGNTLMQNLWTPIGISCLFVLCLFTFGCVIILSLIPIYLEERNIDSSSTYQGSNRLLIIYKTDLSNESSIATTSDVKTFENQLKQIYGLNQIDLSVIGYNWNVRSENTQRKKRQTIPNTCEDGSTLDGISLSFTTSISPSHNKFLTDNQWKQLEKKLTAQLNSKYKQFNMSIPLVNQETKPVQMTFCSSQLLADDEILTNKTILDCDVVILGGGIAGAHQAYRLAPNYGDRLCLFERENHVGGRTYDLDFNGSGNSSEAYSSQPVLPMGGIRFYENQPIIKQLADELNISSHTYSYGPNLIKSRGRFFSSYEDMCSTSFVNMNCSDDADGNNVQDQIWLKMLDEFERNPSNLYRFADVNAFCRDLIGDEATEYLRESFRFRADFVKTDVYSYLEFTKQDWQLGGTIYYPNEGLSQLSKRMIYKATNINNARVYLNEQVMEINRNQSKFSIETTNYQINGKQLVIAIPPTEFINIQGSIANQIQSDQHFQSILPVRTAVIGNSWPRRWWTETTRFDSTTYRAWTRQNCISFIEILSQQPEREHLNITRTVYDDGLCVDTWNTLIQRSSQTDLIDELLRGLKGIFTDVDIPRPTKTFTKIWPGAWYFQKANSNLTNKQIRKWALKPISTLESNQLSMIGEAYNIDRSGWTDGAVKSSLLSLHSQFSFPNQCFSNDGATEGDFCLSNFI